MTYMSLFNLPTTPMSKMGEILTFGLVRSMTTAEKGNGSAFPFQRVTIQLSIIMQKGITTIGILEKTTYTTLSVCMCVFVCTHIIITLFIISFVVMLHSSSFIYST